MGEVVNGLIALIDRPNLSDDDLFRLIPGPDFPTGGEIIGTEGIRDAYRTGRGSIPIRGISQFEEIRPGRGRQRRNAIVVTELPYQVNKAGWIEKIAQLVNAGRIDGIADIRDESDREGMRVVIELKREAQAHRILQDLYRMTPLQTNFGVIMLALDNGQPRQMPLREILQAFLDFRETTLTRHYQHQLDKIESRLHVLEGLLVALNNLDAIIDILRNAPDGTTAKQEFQRQFDLSERQSDAILAMPLRG
jgi:DNA gyrase subunit A